AVRGGPTDLRGIPYFLLGFSESRAFPPMLTSIDRAGQCRDLREGSRTIGPVRGFATRLLRSFRQEPSSLHVEDGFAEGVLDTVEVPVSVGCGNEARKPFPDVQSLMPEVVIEETCQLHLNRKVQIKNRSEILQPRWHIIVLEKSVDSSDES